MRRVNTFVMVAAVALLIVGGLAFGPGGGGKLQYIRLLSVGPTAKPGQPTWTFSGEGKLITDKDFMTLVKKAGWQGAREDAGLVGFFDYLGQQGWMLVGTNATENMADWYFSKPL